MSKTIKDILKNQAGIDGTKRVSITQALSDLASAVRGMPRTAFLGRYAKTIREITINDVARWVEGKEGR